MLKPLTIALILLAPLVAAPNLKAILEKPILEVDLPMVEVQIFAATRVPAIPPVQTAEQWKRVADDLRRKVLDEVILRGEAKKWRAAKSRVEWLDTIQSDKGYRIRKLRFEAVPGLWIPALLYEPARMSGKVPAVLNLNGHEKGGNAIPYIQERCINLAKRGILALNVEWMGRGQLATSGFVHYRQNQLDLAGTSGLSVFFLALEHSLDVLLSLEHTDPERVAVTGLSGGGWQTIMLSALDQRVRLMASVAGFSSYMTRAQFPMLDLGDPEQTPTDLATVVDYTHLTAMMAPRPTLISYNANDDCCFLAQNSLAPLVQAARPIFQLLDAGPKFRQHVNYDKGHNYGPDNREALYRMLRDFFYAGRADFPVAEIPSIDEVRTAEQLLVPMPADNLDLHSLAVQVSKGLPRAGSPGRARLAEIVRAHSYQVDAKKVDSQAEDGIAITRWRLRMDNDWTVPAVELAPANPKSTVLLVADTGRTSQAPQIQQLLAEGKRVIAMDPFYFGESAISKRDILFALLVAAVGDRPLGIEASQVAAVARWLHQQRQLGPVTVIAHGRRSSLFSLVAAALEPQSIGSLETHQAMASLQEVIAQDLTSDKAPELFCFGLLAEFDIPQISALVAPRSLRSVP